MMLFQPETLQPVLEGIKALRLNPWSLRFVDPEMQDMYEKDLIFRQPYLLTSIIQGMMIAFISLGWIPADYVSWRSDTIYGKPAILFIVLFTFRIVLVIVALFPYFMGRLAIHQRKKHPNDPKYWYQSTAMSSRSLAIARFFFYFLATFSVELPLSAMGMPLYIWRYPSSQSVMVALQHQAMSVELDFIHVVSCNWLLLIFRIISFMYMYVQIKAAGPGTAAEIALDIETNYSKYLMPLIMTAITCTVTCYWMSLFHKMRFFMRWRSGQAGQILESISIIASRRHSEKKNVNMNESIVFGGNKAGLATMLSAIQSQRNALTLIGDQTNHSPLSSPLNHLSPDARIPVNPAIQDNAFKRCKTVFQSWLNNSILENNQEGQQKMNSKLPISSYQRFTSRIASSVTLIQWPTAILTIILGLYSRIKSTEIILGFTGFYIFLWLIGYYFMNRIWVPKFQSLDAEAAKYENSLDHDGDERRVIQSKQLSLLTESTIILFSMALTAPFFWIIWNDSGANFIIITYCNVTTTSILGLRFKRVALYLIVIWFAAVIVTLFGAIGQSSLTNTFLQLFFQTMSIIFCFLQSRILENYMELFFEARRIWRNQIQQANKGGQTSKIVMGEQT